MRHYLFIFLAALALLQSCAPAKPLQSQLNYKIGQSLRFRQTAQTETQTTVFGSKDMQTSTDIMEYECKLLETLPDGNQRWEMVISRFSKNQETPKGDVNFDTSDPNRDTTPIGNRIFEHMVGHSMYMKAKPNGDLIEFTGTSTLIDKMVEPIKDKPEMLPLIRSLSTTFNDSAMLQTMRNMWGEYPPKAVKVGDSWVRQKKTISMIPLNTVYRYKLISRNDEQAVISAKSLSITLDPNDSEVDLGVMQLKYQLQGSGKGQMVLHQPDGSFMRSSMTVQLKGTMQMQGKQIPKTDVPLETKTVVTIEKL